MAAVIVYADPTSQAHTAGGGHPERPERLQACLAALAGAGIPTTDAAAPATLEQLARVHDRTYLRRLEAFCARGGGSIDADTYAGRESFEIARRASGLVCAAVEAPEPAMCLVRPPGHHATAGRAMGFCLLNHVAVAAAHARAAGAARVAIVDYDVHHGNGTQDIFWEDPGVLYASLHQFPWYPGSGARGETGGGPGAGATLNVPLPAGTTDEEYLDAVHREVLPALAAFGPDLVLVSAGFDAHAEDPLASMLMTAPGFAAMTSLLVAAAGELCGGRIVLTLEGGYHLPALADSVLAALGALEAA